MKKVIFDPDADDGVAKRLRQTIAVLDLLKPLSIHCTVNTAIAFLTIGLRPGITVGYVQKTLGLQPTSTARSVSLLYKSARGIPGLNLVETVGSAVDLRVKHCYLTPKGQKLFDQITAALS